MADEQSTTNDATAKPEGGAAPKKTGKKASKKASAKPAKKAAKASKKASKASKKAGKASKKAAKAKKAGGGDEPLWKKMGWNKPGRKGGKRAGKAAKATPAVSRALARSGTAVTNGADVKSLLVAALKRAVDTADYENARQILGLLEKQKR